ncbi:hypothetical protein LTR08_001050 [Meristemomyces frigidus]|nr:hypothetical protein LTR08_001050 [Meristemomyces frigidus]
MAPSSLQHRRTHNLLLITKLLSQRDVASPFTLVLDSLEQSAQPLTAEYIRRAKAANVQVIFVAFETLRRPRGVDAFVPAWKLPLQSWQNEVTAALKARSAGPKSLILIDTLNPLSATEPAALPATLAALISPTTALLAVYHTDVPCPCPAQRDAYAPAPLTLLKYLATTLFTVHALHHVLARKAARERSHGAPAFGLEEGAEGVLQALGANGRAGVVLEMEWRRKSGRGVGEWFFLLPPLKDADAVVMGKAREQRHVTLLEDHPLYRSPEPEATAANAAGAEDGEVEPGTFALGLTAKQRRDREGVVLPYTDAQRGEGGEGGRILYDMGSEDDFDEEEDEI